MSLFLLSTAGMLSFGALPAFAQAATPQVVVHAVLFTSPPCGFCTEIVEQELPPLIERFGDQLQILTVDINTAEGESLFQAAVEAFDEPRGTPEMFIGEHVLIGENIPEHLPALVDELLAQGGAGWPAIPGLEEYLAASQAAETPAPLPASTATEQENPEPLVPVLGPPAGAEGPVVRAVLFWMDTCGHCHFIIDEVLPPLQAKYGEQLEILLVQLITMEDIDRLYQAGAAFGMAKEDVGVPFLVIGEHALVGSEQIPAELPGLIETYLAQGGVEFSTLEAVVPYLPSAARQAEEACDPKEPCAVPDTPLPAVQGSAEPSVRQAIPGGDGFVLAYSVLVLMLAVLGFTGLILWRRWSQPAVLRQAGPGSRWSRLAFLLLVAAGLGVSGYLTYVETQMVQAVCGPVGDCNAVQASPYARLFGFLPLGILGLAGYLAILAAWSWSQLRQGWLAEKAPRVLLGLALFGVVFSLYLTYLELFVIRAVCMWCLASAVIMSLLLLLALLPAAAREH